MKTELLTEIFCSPLLDFPTISLVQSCTTRLLETLERTVLNSLTPSLLKESFQESRSMSDLPQSKELMMRLPLWVLTVWLLEQKSTTPWELDLPNGELLSKSTPKLDAHPIKLLRRQLILLQGTAPSVNMLDLSQSSSQRSSRTEITLSKNALRFPRKFSMPCNQP